MKTYIHVTDKHIDRGVAGDSRKCALAIASEEALPGFEIIYAVYHYLQLKHLVSQEIIKVDIPAGKFVRQFDSWKNKWQDTPRPQPTTFEIEIPDQDTSQKAVSSAPVARSKRFEAPEAILSRGDEQIAYAHQ